MLSPTCSATVRLQRTKLENDFDFKHKTPQLNKHGVGGWRLVPHLILEPVTLEWYVVIRVIN